MTGTSSDAYARGRSRSHTRGDLAAPAPDIFNSHDQNGYRAYYENNENSNSQDRADWVDRRYDYPRGRQDRRVPTNYSGVRQRNTVKIPPFTGKEDWLVWSARFEAIAKRFDWDEEDMLDQLLPRLEGQASEFVFSQLPPAILNSYPDLVAELNSRYRVIHTARSYAAKFSKRSQKYGETAEDFAADLKMLYDKGHGYRDRRTRNEDLVRRFLDGLVDEEVRFEVEYHKEPETIDEAVFHVVNFIQTRNCGDQKYGKRGARRTLDDEDGLVSMDNCDNRDQIYRMPDRRSGTTSRTHRIGEDIKSLRMVRRNKTAKRSS